jgi:ubiquinone/menaquinone biosynthesis C-methylase UbiE
MQTKRTWTSHVRRTLERHPELEAWKGHVEQRMVELDRVDRLSGRERYGDLIEIGCGNGIGTVFFADRTDRIVATDIPEADLSRHTRALTRPQQLFGLLGISHAEAIACSGESLPFPDESFDTALSIYSLEHIPDRLRCVTETARVLKPGGLFIAVVPATAWAFLEPIDFYRTLALSLVRRIAYKLRRVHEQLRRRPNEYQVLDEEQRRNVPGRVVSNLATFRAAYPHFPFPEPHGEYENLLDELLSQRPSRWAALFREGGFADVRVESLAILPPAIAELAGQALGREAEQQVLDFDERLSDVPDLTPLAQFVCVYAVKGWE